MNQQLLKAFVRSGMTAYRLAKTTGISQQTIRRWIEGTSDIGLSKAESIASALGIKIKLVKG